MSNVIKRLGNCHFCGKEFVKASKLNKFCTQWCANKNYTSKRSQVRIPLSTGKIGAIAELVVSADLILKGFDVFRAVSQSSDADLIGERDKVTYRFEVRTGRYLNSGLLVYPKRKTNGKSVIVFVFEDRTIHYVTNPEIKDMFLPPKYPTQESPKQ